MKVEIISAIFDRISKQQENLSLLLSDWYCQKLGLTDLPGHDGKLASDMTLFRASMKDLREQTEIIAAFFGHIPNNK